MEKFIELREVAEKKIKIADHMLNVTYPLLKEGKLLMSVVDNLFLAYSNTMGSILYYDRMFNKIPSFEDNFDSKFNLFFQKSIKFHDIDNMFIKDMKDLKEIIVEHKKSAVEFTKKDKLVICSDKFETKIITVKDMQSYINKCILFIKEAKAITSENERLFRSSKE